MEGLEHETAQGPGVISFISASSYLDGDAFGGMREHLRRQCDDIWILDLGGEGRGARRSDNVFAIQTPVAIAVAVRTKAAKPDTPAAVHYARIDGTRDEKLAELDAISGFSAVAWQDCPADWQAPFRPAGQGRLFRLAVIDRPDAVAALRCPVEADVADLRRMWKPWSAVGGACCMPRGTKSGSFHGLADGRPVRILQRSYPPCLDEDSTDSPPISNLREERLLPERATVRLPFL